MGKFTRVTIGLSLVFSLCLGGTALGKGKTPSNQPPQVAEILPDFRADEVTLLEDAQALDVNLTELTRRIQSLSTQAIVVGDGDMLACTEPLREEASELNRVLTRVKMDLLTAISEGDVEARGYNVILLDIMVGRAQYLDREKEDCMGSEGKIYVEMGDFEPSWTNLPPTSQSSQRRR